MVWKKWHEELLLAKVSIVELYEYGTKERGKGKCLTALPNALKDLGFQTTHRSARDKSDKMLMHFEKKENEEKKACGVDVQYTEIDKALEDIKGRIVEVDKVQEREKVAADQMRSKAMETLSETKK